MLVKLPGAIIVIELPDSELGRRVAALILNSVSTNTSSRAKNFANMAGVNKETAFESKFLKRYIVRQPAVNVRVPNNIVVPFGSEHPRLVSPKAPQSTLIDDADDEDPFTGEH